MSDAGAEHALAGDAVRDRGAVDRAAEQRAHVAAVARLRRGLDAPPGILAVGEAEVLLSEPEGTGGVDRGGGVLADRVAGQSAERQRELPAARRQVEGGQPVVGGAAVDRQLAGDGELRERGVGQPGDLAGVRGDRHAIDLDLGDLVVDPAVEPVGDQRGQRVVQLTDCRDAGVVGRRDQGVGGVGREPAQGRDDALCLVGQEHVDGDVDLVDELVRPGRDHGWMVRGARIVGAREAAAGEHTH